MYLGDLMAQFGYARDYADTESPALHELMFAQFMQPLERIFNGESTPFYTDSFASSLSATAKPVAFPYKL